MATITRYQGDTIPDNIAVQHPNASAYDITGCTFTMTVTQKVKATVTTLFVLTGVITNAPAGLVGFTPTPTQASLAVGAYTFTIRMTTADGAVQTILSDIYLIV